MSAKQDLFSIGEFSKVTGVSIHSLRYYDEIGALKPEYVDPVSNYRYYSFDQLRLIPGINICIDAGIKLSEFERFITEDSIDYGKLINDSKTAIEKRIEEYRIQENELDKMENILSILDHSSETASEPVYLYGQDVWVMPFENDSLEDNEAETLVRLSSHAKKHGCQISPLCFGLIHLNTGSHDQIFAFARISHIFDPVKAESFVIHIPSGNYRISRSNTCSLRHTDLMPGQQETELPDFIISFIMMGKDLHGSLYFSVIKSN